MTSTHTVPRGQDHDRISNETNNSPLVPINNETDISIGQKMMSAVTGSILTSLLVTPLDVVRVRLQSQQPSAAPDLGPLTSHLPRSFNNLPSHLGVTSCCREVFWVNNNAQFCVVGSGAAELPVHDCAVEEVQRRHFTSTFDGLRKIARNEGFTTLWRGLSPTLVMAVPGNVIYFAGYDWLRTNSSSPMHNRIQEAYAPLIAGSTARVLAALVVSPIELFRTRMQASSSKSASTTFSSTMSSVKDMVQTQGYHTLWRGLSMTLWRDVPFSAFYWWGYEAVRNKLLDARSWVGSMSPLEQGSPRAEVRQSTRRQMSHTNTLIDSFVAGAASGGVAAVVTTPFDVGKTRQQVYQHVGDLSKSGSSTTGLLGPGDSSMPKLLLHIFRDEGVSGLFRGWAARCLKVAPACAIMISTYEIGKRMALTSEKHSAEEP